MNISDTLKSFLLRASAARVAILFLFHAIVFAGCYAFAWLVRFEFQPAPDAYMVTVKYTFPLVIGVQLLVGFLFGFYRGWWRYVGMTDVIRIFAGMTTALLVLLAAWYAGGVLADARYVRAPRGVLMIDWAFALLTLFGARVVMRLSRDRFRPAEGSSDVRRVLIVGAGDAGETLAREIEHRPQLGMKVVAFVDDQRAKWGSMIRGIQVRGPISEIGRLSDELQAADALIAIPSASGKRMREIIHQLSEADLEFKTIPGIDALVSGRVHVTQLRPVNVEDLLRRKRIDLRADAVRALFNGKRVLITGAGGTIGSELSSQILQFEPESLALVERSEFALYEVRKRLARDAAWASTKITSNLVDICDTSVVDALMAREQPHIVVHAAAHKHVPLGEENPPEYVRNNTIATRWLAELATKHDVERFVFISSDKAINPSSVMGATKRAAEILLLDHAATTSTKMTIVRFGNVIGSSGSAIPLFLEQIAAGGPVTVTHPDVTRYFIRTSEAISLVLQAATLGREREVFMLDMGEPVKVAELARDLIRLSSHAEDEIQVVFTGLRPGEKMFEEIRLQGEDVKPTVHPHIVVTEAPQPPSSTVAAWLQQAQTFSSDTAAVLRLLKQLIPEYQRELGNVELVRPRPAEPVIPVKTAGRQSAVRTH
ncbi:MAG TPA: nucleoside-diphosphate sugar epimerase/dehydratase [Thermoanaerobaculia bacterium]